MSTCSRAVWWLICWADPHKVLGSWFEYPQERSYTIYEKHIHYTSNLIVYGAIHGGHYMV
jgi:hypothetical protein